MTDKRAAALADALDPTRYCLHCGHDERVPLGEHAIACCPDSKYLSVQGMIDRIRNLSSEIASLTNELRKMRAMLMDQQMKAHPPERPKPDHAEWVIAGRRPTWKAE